MIVVQQSGIFNMKTFEIATYSELNLESLEQEVEGVSGEYGVILLGRVAMAVNPDLDVDPDLFYHFTKGKIVQMSVYKA